MKQIVNKITHLEEIFISLNRKIVKNMICSNIFLVIPI